MQEAVDQKSWEARRQSEELPFEGEDPGGRGLRDWTVVLQDQSGILFIINEFS
jgi:hypothetical protein